MNLPRMVSRSGVSKTGNKGTRALGHRGTRAQGHKGMGAMGLVGEEEGAAEVGELSGGEVLL